MQMLAACRRATRQASIVYARDSPSVSKKSVVLLCESKTYREMYTIPTWWNIGRLSISGYNMQPERCQEQTRKSSYISLFISIN